MRRSLLVCVVLVMAGALLTSGCGGNDSNKSPAEVQLTDADDGSTIQLAIGGQLVVALQSNPTTGFGWSVSESSDPQLEVQGEPTYVPAGSTTQVVGAGGTGVFSFDAKDKGTAKLILEYKRDFEPGVAPEKTFSVTVEIR
jgi:inhibitor of cysteine peptidase